ncbi:MAG: EAL domain-containing protein [Pseudomonadota bacterium]
MTRWLYRFPINVSLPILLFVAAVILASAYTFALVQDQQATILTNAERELTTEITRMQRLIQNATGQPGLRHIQEEIAALGPDVRVRLARVVDDRNRILAALERGEQDRPLLDSLKDGHSYRLADPIRDLLTITRERRAAHLRYIPEASTLIATAHLELTDSTVRLGPSPAGAVILAWDLSYPFAQAREAALHSAALMSPVLLGAFVALWWLLYSVLGRRLSLLSHAAEQIAGGETRQRAAVTGNDEIGRLATAFNRMTDTLVAEQEALRTSEQRLHLAQSYAGIGSWEWDIASDRVVWTEQTCRLFGVDPDDPDISFQRYLDQILPEDRERVRDAIHSAFETGERYVVEHRLRGPDGEIRWILGQGNTLRDAAGKPLRMYGVVQDITQTKQAEEALFREKEHAQVTLSSIGDGVITTDTEGCVRFLNPVAEYLTGHNTESARGRPLTEVFRIINEFSRQPAIDPVARCLRKGRIVGLANHTILLRPDGEEFAIEDSAAPIRDREGSIVGVVLVFHDVTQARELANQLSWQATHDPLTHLPNRHAFEERLHQLAHTPEASHGQENHTLLYIDLDQFKVVNDIAGHTAGDQMIRQVGNLMLEQIRETDLLARLGGDEFGVILEDCDIEQARRVAGTIHTVLDEFRFAWEERVFRISASIGILEFHPGAQTMTELLSRADMAVYAAKNAGRRRSHVFDSNDAEMQQQHHEMDWAAQISDAVENDRLMLFGQTIQRLGDPAPDDLHTGLSFEVLVRLRDADDNLIAPGVFLPAAERFNLISIVDRWIITRAFSMVSEHIREHGPDSIRHCAINLSGGTLGDESLLPFIKNQLSLHALPGSIFCFEITETAAISNFQAAMRFIRDLRAMGCRFALDDFGSGLSSFAYLKTLPVDFLKIDGSFVRNIADDPVNRALVGNIHSIGRLLNKQTIAEFAEDDRTIEMLRELQVDHAQGYGIHRPEPLERLLR